MVDFTFQEIFIDVFWISYHQNLPAPSQKEPLDAINIFIEKSLKLKIPWS